jgi:diguanylate cyclase (GGDEF)-like protein/PAS domain S-box-containing protein
VSVSLQRNLLHPDPLLASAEQAAAAALRELPEALILVFDGELRHVLTAGQVLERVGDPEIIREGEFVGRMFPQDLWSAIEPLFRSALEGETRSREAWTDGQRHCLMVDVGPLPLDGADSGASVTGTGGVAVVVDITARRRADALALNPRGGFEQVFEQAPIGTGLLDADGRWLLVNRTLCDITGYTSDELIGTRFDGIVHPEDANNDLEQRQRLLAGEIPAFQVEKRYFDAAGEAVSAILSMSLVRDRDGAPLHYIAQLQDISERRRLEEQVRKLADHDPLTGLRNRRLFEHDLKLQVSRSQRYGEAAGLMVIDLDAFKQINERHGQAVGDKTLKALARALTRRLRQTDLVARLGGDEFAVLLPHIDAEGLAVVADGLSRVIPGCSIEAGETVLHPSASIGLVLIDKRTPSADQALAEARRAMYAEKRAKPPLQV